jgi:hypothetical protein
MLGALSLLIGGCGGTSSERNTDPQSTVDVAVEPNKVMLSVPYIGQQATEWCWAASIQMVLANDHITDTQNQIVLSTYGIIYDYPASAGQIQSQLKLLSGESLNPQIVYQQLTFAQIQQKIQQNIPIIVQYEASSDTQGHFVVIYGYDDAGNIYINDPLYGQLTLAYSESGSYQKPGGETMYWILSIEV